MMERLGWTLIQFLWQGAAIAGAYAVARLAVRAAEARYLLACAAMAAMLAAPPATFLYLGRGVAAPAAAVGGAVAAQVAQAAATPWQADSWTRVVSWLAVVWLAGVLLLLGRLAGGWWLTSRLRTRGAQTACAEWGALLEAAMQRVGVARPVRLLISVHVDAPMVIGWLRPLILMPASALTGLPREHVAALLAHELAHIRRHDYLVNLAQSIVEALLFYHPAVWWVSGQMRAERELCCDDAAVAVGGDVLTYARALAGFEGLRPSHVRSAVPANAHSLRGRIRRLLHPSDASEMLPGPGAGWVVALAIAAICVVAVMPAAPPQATVVSREAFWAATVKRGDMERAVRGLGKMTSASAAEIQIIESQVKDVVPGQAVKLDVRVAPKKSTSLPGTVARVSAQASGGMLAVDVDVTGKAPAAVKAGQAVDGIITIEFIHDVVHVGRPVFGKENGEGSLFKISADGNSAVRTKVQFGRSSVNMIEVRSGLQVGDKVILSDMRKYDGVDRVTLK